MRRTTLTHAAIAESHRSSVMRAHHATACPASKLRRDPLNVDILAAFSETARRDKERTLSTASKITAPKQRHDKRADYPALEVQAECPAPPMLPKPSRNPLTMCVYAEPDRDAVCAIQ